jgi:hypothetical protein
LTLPAHAVHDIGMGHEPKQRTIQPQTRRARKTAQPVGSQSARTGKKSVTVYLSPEKWRELKIIAALTDATLDKLLQEGADVVIEKFRRTRADLSTS